MSKSTLAWILGCLLAAGMVARSDRLTAESPAGGAEAEVAWHDVRQIGVEGRAWPDADMKRYFARLPGRAEGKVPPAVWGLSQHSAGLAVRFETDATTIRVRYALQSAGLAMPHMPATGVSGVDLYAQDDQGVWRWVAVSKPDKQQIEAVLASGLQPGKRQYMLYLPLYNGVESLEIGVPAGAAFQGLPPRPDKPIVFYGTSIVHGGCASRPGMCHPAILGRRLNRPVVNLGFSGNGRMDASVGDFLSEIDAAVFVIDCLPNMSPDLVKERTVPLVHRLGEARPGAAIVLVEDRVMTNAWIRPDQAQRHRENHAALRAAFEQLKAENVPRLFYVEGDHLLGDDNDGATDGSHPSDLGFFRQADAMEPVLKQALEAAEK